MSIALTNEVKELRQRIEKLEARLAEQPKPQPAQPGTLALPPKKK